MTKRTPEMELRLRGAVAARRGVARIARDLKVSEITVRNWCAALHLKPVDGRKATSPRPKPAPLLRHDAFDRKPDPRRQDSRVDSTKMFTIWLEIEEIALLRRSASRLGVSAEQFAHDALIAAINPKGNSVEQPAPAVTGICMEA